MRIGFFSDSYLPVNFGLENSIETFRKNLEKFGHQVFIFAPRFSKTKETKKSLPKIFHFPSFKVKNEPEGRLLFFDAQDVDRLSELNLDIVHSHTPWTAGWLAKMVAKKSRIPLFSTIHTLYPGSEYVSNWLTKKNKIIPSLLRWPLKFYCNFCDQIIAPSLKVKNSLKKWGVKKPIHILPTGVDLKKINQFKKDLSWQKKYHLGPENKILLYVGRLSREKNIPFLIKSFNLVNRQIKKTVFVLVGHGPQKEELKKMVQELGLNGKVIFLGIKSHSQTLKIYKNTDLFIFSSLVETQSLVLTEAIAAGLPIVALKDQVCQGLVENNKNGYLVTPYQPKIFAEKIVKILTNQEKIQKFSDHSRQLSKKFSASLLTQKLIKLYQLALKKNG